MQGPPPGLQLTFATLTGARRVTFEPDSLLLEIRDNLTGSLQPEDELFWEEVESVYVWQTPDWITLAVTLLAIILPITLLVSIVLSLMRPDQLGLFLGLMLVLSSALVFFLLRFQPLHHVRVRGAGREIRFSSSDRHYVRVLLRAVGATVPWEYLSREEARERRAENTHTGAQ